MGNWRRYPDAILFTPSTVTIVEASVKPDPGKISLLDLYARLFPLTPEFAGWTAVPIEKLLVFGLPDPVLEQVAREHGVRVEIFQPQWVRDYILQGRPRDQRSPRMGVTPGPTGG